MLPHFYSAIDRLNAYHPPDVCIPQRQPTCLYRNWIKRENKLIIKRHSLSSQARSLVYSSKCMYNYGWNIAECVCVRTNEAADSLPTYISVLMIVDDSLMVVYSILQGDGGVSGGWHVLRWSESFSCTTTSLSLTLKCEYAAVYVIMYFKAANIRHISRVEMW